MSTILNLAGNDTAVCHLIPTTVAGEHDLFIRVLLMLFMITAALNLAHFLKHQNFTYLGESAVYIILGLLVSAGWTSMSYDPGNTAIQLNSEFFSWFSYHLLSLRADSISNASLFSATSFQFSVWPYLAPFSRHL
ncbi:hypothetical protein BASA61_001807 [Batrachochytrium salamandrivorans]|nr:hypothetical protein BASA61_001807 [Batrachochytrium salamandrivorans]